MNRTLTAFAVASLFAGAATAQTSTDETQTGMADDQQAVGQESDGMAGDAMTAKFHNLEDVELRTVNGETVGEVDEILVDPDGPAVAVVVEVGGFLDIGDRDVMFRLDELKMEEGMLVTTMTREQIGERPDWNEQ